MIDIQRIVDRERQAFLRWRRHRGGPVDWRTWNWILILDAARHQMERNPRARDVARACPCGRRYTLDRFRRLPLAGVQSFTDSHDRLELRTCTCRSTMGLWIDADGSPAVP
jgi:hypothetical protein